MVFYQIRISGRLASAEMLTILADVPKSHALANVRAIIID